MKNNNSKYTRIYKRAFERIEKILPEELIGKNDVIQRRYKGIYGNESIEERVHLYRRNNLKRFLLLIAGIFLVIIGFLLTEIGGDNYLITNEAGEIIAIRDPAGQEIVIPMEVGVLVEGEEKKEFIKVFGGVMFREIFNCFNVKDLSKAPLSAKCVNTPIISSA